MVKKSQKVFSRVDLSFKEGFKGFLSNRFGRLGELSAAMVNHAPLLNKFFESQVDEHANKLVLAVSCYKESDWFVHCSEVACQFYMKVCLPIKWLLGIDEYKDTAYPGGRSWKTTKRQFSEILSNLKDIGNNPGATGKEHLVSKVANKFSGMMTSMIYHRHRRQI